MPNWCFTSYCIEGSKTEITDLYQKLQSLSERKESLHPNGFGLEWLGNIVLLLGGDFEQIKCRGSFHSLSLSEDGVLRFDTATAWGEMNEVWEFVKKSYPSIQYYWLAEEGGNCYYATNDKDGKYFPERVIIDQTYSGTEYYATDQAALDDIVNIIGKPVSDWEQAELLIKEYNTLNEDTIGIYRISVVE